jgi:HK97 gp10 family phage protein
MASSGGYKANFYLTGFKRSDPFATRLRQIKSIANRKKVIFRAMANAGQSMRDAMEAGAPVRTGVLSQSYRIRRLKNTPQFVFGVRIGAISGPRVVSPGMLDNAKIDGYDEGDQFQMAGWRDHWAELGTRYQRAQPHVQPAIKKHLSTYNLRLRRALAEIFQTKFYKKMVGQV